MDDDGPNLRDTDLRAAILTGLAAVAELEARFRKPLERFLVGMCDKGDGRSQEKAVEIAGQILAECFTKSPSLLEKWQGGDNLEAFLRTAAGNRLRSWWGSPEKKRTEVNSDSLSLTHAAGNESGSDPEEVDLAERALRAGVGEATGKCPEGLVFMRLKGLHGVDQRLISQCWGHHEAQTSRRIKEAMEIIRTEAGEMAANGGYELSMDHLQQALQRDPGILLGGRETAGADGDYQSLRLLAEGGADAVTKRLAVEQMCGDPRMLAFFAQTLNRRSELDALVVRDPELSGMSARLGECVRRSLEILKPSEAAGLVTSAMSECFADLLAHVGADGGTLWLLCPGAAALEAVFNPLEPEIAGKRQPLVSGIVSLVLATGEPVCVSGVATHRNHSPAIDIALGKTTHGMIAVPFVLGGVIRGVMTAVRLTGDEPFGENETRIVGRYAEILANLMVRNLTVKILG
ncbi:MAG: GAF domain-containing protein [Verrucomicrobiota bacterium]